MNSTVINGFKSGAWESLAQVDEMTCTAIDRTVSFAIATYEVLTSDQAIKTYRMIWRAAVIAAMVAYAIVLTIAEMIDRDVQSHIARPAGDTSEVVTEDAVKAIANPMQALVDVIDEIAAPINFEPNVTTKKSARKKGGKAFAIENV